MLLLQPSDSFPILRGRTPRHGLGIGPAIFSHSFLAPEGRIRTIAPSAMPSDFARSRVLRGGDWQDASETRRPYSLSGRIAIEECSKRNSFSAGVVAFCPNGRERTHTQTTGLGPVPYLWILCRAALCAAFGRFALGVTFRTKVPRR